MKLTTLLALGLACLPSLAAAQAPKAVSQGSYECWGNGSPRMLLNFKVTGNGKYSDPDGKQQGTYNYNPSNGEIAFKGGHLDGVMPNGFKSVYHENKNRPTVSFRSGRGAEASFCERK